MFQIKLTSVLLISEIEKWLFTCFPPKEIGSTHSCTTAPTEQVRTVLLAEIKQKKQHVG